MPLLYLLLAKAGSAGSQLNTILKQQQNYNYNAVHALIAYLGLLLSTVLSRAQL